MIKGNFYYASRLFFILATVLFAGSKAYAQLPSDSTIITPLSLNKSVSVSSNESSSYPGSNAVDASRTSKWSSSSSGFNQYLVVDLGAVYDINRVTIDWADGRYATTFDIMVSKDTATLGWQTLKTISGNTASVSRDIEGLDVDARYIKFNGRGRANPLGYRISDFRVYGYSPTTAAQVTELNTLSSRLLANYAIQNVAADNTLTTYINTMATNGSWPDVTYIFNGTWPTHASRLSEMALAFHKPGNTYYQSTVIRDKITKGLNYLKRTNPQGSAWFTTKISVPEKIMVTCLILKNKIPNDSLLYYSSYLVDYTPNAGFQGRNRTWVAGVTVHKGCIENRQPITNSGFSAMGAAMDVVSVNSSIVDGLKSDNSFHMHNPQLYTGGYGSSFAEYLAYYWRYSDGLSYNSYFTAARKQRLSDYILKGLQLLSYKRYMDFGSIGRYIARSTAIRISYASMLDTMKLNDPANSTAYDNFKTHNNVGTSTTTPFPSAYLGTKYFWNSAILTSHGSNFYMSAKVISSRTYGTECINQENRKGFNLPLGATNIMRTGGEYLNIFPVWQWSRIPGVTAELNEAATEIARTTRYVTATNDFGGGLSRGDDAILAYEHDLRGIKASKSYFFMNNQLICLGAGINGTKSNEIITSVDQSIASGDVTFNSGTTQTLAVDSMTATSVKWVHHNDIGYFFPAGTGLLTVMKKNQTGRWSDIGTGSTTLQTTNVFSTYFRHSTTPSNRHYVYVVAPDVTLTEMPTVDTALHYTFPRNESDIQAVRHDGANKKYAVVFYEPGSIDMGDGVIISSNQKALVFVKEYSTNYRISVADPIYTQGSLTIKINKQLTGSGASYSNGVTTINFSVPSGDLAGGTVTGFFDKPTGSSLMAANSNTLSQADGDLANKKPIVVYPNPATDRVSVDLSGVKTSNPRIVLYDGFGRALRDVKASTDKTTISTGNLATGTYYVHVFDGGKLLLRRALLIEK